MARTKASVRERDVARARLLDAAHAEFASRGFRAATLDAIAARAGTTRTALLHHFGSKAGMLLALLDARDTELGIDESWTGAASVRDLYATIATMNREILASREVVQLAHALTAEGADPDHPAHTWLVRRSARIRGRLAEVYRAAAATGEIPAGLDPDALAALTLGAVEGLEAQWLVDPDAVDVDTSLTQLASLLLTPTGGPP